MPRSRLGGDHDVTGVRPTRGRRATGLALACLVAATLSSCASRGRIIVCGEDVAVDAHVVTFKDPGGYDAYLERCHFDPERRLPSSPAAGCNTPNRYSQRSVTGLSPEAARSVETDGWTAATLAERVRLFVLHFDVCVTSARCFKVLHDVRGLSVHFMLDIDGTIYQTLDLAERARHAGTANDASIGIEIAHIGCYPPDKPEWRKYYQPDGDGWVLDVPESFGAPEGGPFRTARPGLFRSAIHGREYEMPDYTEAQFRSLVALIDALEGAFPAMRRDFPREADGSVRRSVLSPEELKTCSGLLAHWHVTTGKTDPGPAMDWDRLVGARP